MVLHLLLDVNGARGASLHSLIIALRGVLSLPPAERQGRLEALVAAAENAMEVPLPGLTPGMALEPPADRQLAGLVLAEPVRGEHGELLHPGAA